MRRGDQLGKYRIRRRIASGAFATVYEARDIVLDIPVALKIPKLEDDHELVIDEVRHVMRLEHPNVLPILNVDYYGETLVVATPLGVESLREEILRGVRPQDALDYARQILGGLAHAHERGIIHCDVKPENLILFKDGRLRLCDFGLAQAVRHGISSGTSGTMGYLAPEQAHGRPSKASDVFVAAIVIWEMLTGELARWPFDRPLPGHAKILESAPAILPILDKALAVDERERYVDVPAFLEAVLAVDQAACTENRTIAQQPQALVSTSR
jgi:eukaryotic-like serine/threonine-protein kinase